MINVRNRNPAPPYTTGIGDDLAIAQALQPGLGAGMAEPTTPFVWAHGGLKMSPAEAAAMRQQGMARAQGDYSPVQHWTQGLARVADNVCLLYTSPSPRDRG